MNTEKVTDTEESIYWQKLWNTFNATLEVEPPARNEYLTYACGADQDLYREVVELLSAHEAASLLDNSPFLASVPPSDAGETLIQPTGLQPGDVLANRFELIRDLGRGGMARVYEAIDLDLGTRVAVKMLRWEIASNPQALERFNREVNLAIRITHPNVCRIYDLFHHGETSFLTMQLLQGETLHDRIQNAGPLSASEAFPIIEQLAEALTAAHELGIIHRDLKPTNVMLEPKDSGDHVVLTDFGMAVAIAETRLTTDGQFIGTPEYMAPEQLGAGDVSAATDVYALGLLMYEMVTGKLPFHGDSPFSIASSRLRSPVLPPRKLNPELSRTWEKTILHCLQTNPQDRIQTPAEVIVALKGGHVSTRLFTDRRKQQIGAALAILLTVLIAFALFVYLPGDKESAATLPFEKRDWLLVCAFENKTGDPSFDAVGFTLRRELENSKFLNVVPAERIVDALALMRKPADTRIDGGIAREICLRDAGIRAFLRGNIEQSDSHYIVNAEIIDSARNVVFSSLHAKANSKNDLLKAIHRLSGEVRQKLGEQISEIRQSEKKLETVTTPSLRALQLFSKADTLMATGVWGEQARAESLLREAIAADPGFASAYTHLAWTIFNQGKSGYLPYAKKALDLSETVSDRERYFIRASYLHISGKWEEAASNYQLLIHFFPDYYWPYDGLIDVLMNELQRYDEAVPYIIRRSEIRPNDYEAMIGGVIMLAQANRFKEAEMLLKRASPLVPQMPAPQLSKLSVDFGFDFIKMQRFWIQGDVTSELQLLKKWTARLESGSASTVQIRYLICYGYMSIGCFHDCRQIYRLEPDQALRDWKLRQVELYRLPVNKWASVLRNYHLEEPPSTDEALFWSSAGLVSESRRILLAAPAKPNDPLVPVIQGQIALKEGKPMMAARLLESALEELRNRKSGAYFRASDSLAIAWFKLGKPENAVQMLENTSPYKNEMRGVASRIWWMQTQLRLADLYSKLGRQADADRIRNELGKLLTHADSDYWMLEELNRKTGSRSLLSH